MSFSPMILVVEDQDQELLQEAFLAQKVAGDNLFVADTVKKAKALLRSHHFHGISIDQRLPMDDGGAVSSDYGLAFTEENRWPLAKRVVYTIYPEFLYANRVGLAGAEYREKKRVSDAGTGRSFYDYAAEFVQHLRMAYVETALIAASQHLPHSLATAARNAASAKQASNWPEFFRTFGELRERLLRLTLAVTLAAQSRKPPWKEGLRAQDVEDALHAAWRRIPVPFRRYVTPPGWEPAEALFNALADLRKLRNAIEHHDRRDYVASDFQEQHGNIVTVIDLLAFFCEIPIMHAPRFHPDKRGLLRFQKMGPNKATVEGEWEAEFDPPPPADAALYMPWRDEKGPQLLSLAPWIISRRDGHRDLEFCVTLGAKPEAL